MKPNSRTTIVLMAVVAILGIIMWLVAVDQDRELEKQNQNISILKDQLSGVTSDAATQAELMLSTNYCTDNPEKVACKEARDTLDNLKNGTKTKSVNRRLQRMECSSNGTWVLTFTDGSTQTPDGLCRLDSQPTQSPSKKGKK